MRVKIIRAAALCLAVMSSIGIYLAGCGDDDKPTGPVESKDYYVYFGNEIAPNTFYRYNTGTMELDSFHLPYNSLLDGYGISPDGNTMFLHPDDAIVEVSLDSFVVVAEHPIYLPMNGSTGNGQEVHISPDGRYIAFLNRYMYVVDMTDFSVVYSDTSMLTANGWFSQDSKSFFWIAFADYGTILLEIELDNPSEAKIHSFENRSVGALRTSPDNKLWFLILGAGGGCLFQVYDVERDSIIFAEFMCPCASDMEITADGRYIIYSQSSSWIEDCTPPKYFTIYDVRRNRIDREVVTYLDSVPFIFSTCELVVTPDSRHLIGLGYKNCLLFDYDLFSNEFKKVEIYEELEPLFQLRLVGQSNP